MECFCEMRSDAVHIKSTQFKIQNIKITIITKQTSTKAHTLVCIHTMIDTIAHAHSDTRRQ